MTTLKRHLMIMLATVLLAGSLSPAMARAGDVAYITAANLKMLVQNKRQTRVAVVDIRPQEEFDAAHIEGAVNMLPEALRTANLPPDEKLVLYDASLDGRLARKTAGELADKGYKNVSVLQGGLLAWDAQNRPVKGAAAHSTISPQQIVRAALDKQEFILVDLSRTGLYEDMHVPGAVNLSPKEINAASTKWEKDSWIVFYGEGDNADKSVRAVVDSMRKRGFNFVAYVPGGYAAILREGTQPAGK